jgi:hypothetical protein
MSEVWSTVIVASVSIIGIVVAQVLGLRSSREQMVLQTRFAFLQEGYKDNVVVWNALDGINVGHEIEKNVEKIQEIVDKRPHNLAIAFLSKWVDSKDDLTDNIKRKEYSNKLYDCFLDNLDFYAKRYYHQVLGLKGKELNDYIESMKPKLKK